MMMEKFVNQRHAMLAGFADAGKTGYTDEQAAKAMKLNLRSCFWKRAGELREMGLIEPLILKGEHMTRTGDAGAAQGVWKITTEGRNQLRMWDKLTRK